MQRQLSLKEKPPRPKTFESFLSEWWWMLLFFALCYLLYSHGIEKKKGAVRELKARLFALEEEKKHALEEREDLLLQINSQSDPSWIQMTLMKGLGMVPEGQVKVYFKKEE